MPLAKPLKHEQKSGAFQTGSVEALYVDINKSDIISSIFPTKDYLCIPSLFGYFY